MEKTITVNIYYTGTNGNARAFAEEMESGRTVAAIRAEKGNLLYEYFFPMGDGETVLLIDQWESQAAIDAHHASPMMAEIAHLREKYDLHMKIERFVSDTDGVPEADKQFIRNGIVGRKIIWRIPPVGGAGFSGLRYRSIAPLRSATLCAPTIPCT